MRFSIWLETQQTWDELIGSAEHAERSGWGGVWVMDHFMPSEEPVTAPRLEAWTAIAGLAACVDRVRVGVLVTGNTYRHPAVLAKMAATVDHISEGRLVLGLGAGWQRNEHESYGLEFPTVTERLARLEEACQVIRLLHSQERSSFEGRFYRLVDAPCEPKPVQRPLPLLIGGRGEQLTLGIVARYADEWNCWGLPEEVAQKSEVLERHCLEIDRDPATIKRSAQALVLMSDNGEQLRHWRSESSPRPRIIGTADQVAETMQRYLDIGLDEFVVSDHTMGRDANEKRDNMDKFVDDVVLALQRPSGA